MNLRGVPTPPYAKREAFTTQGPNAARLIVLHSTEGGSPLSVTRTLRAGGLGIHWIVGENGAVIRGVDSSLATAHVAAYNDQSIGIEQCGYASYRRSRWIGNHWELLNVAWIVAYEAHRHGIPLVFDSAFIEREPGSFRGVCFHSSLGSKGGGHHDPGAEYPVHHVLGMARSITERGLGRVERAYATIHAHGRLG